MLEFEYNAPYVAWQTDMDMSSRGNEDSSQFEWTVEDQPCPMLTTEAFRTAISSRGQMAPSQYFRIVLEILRSAPANVLLFGAGRDSDLYGIANHNGRTVVVESNLTWRDNISREICEVVEIQYSTCLADGFVTDLEIEKSIIAGDCWKTVWDIIVVDAPNGHRPDAPGRQQSIALARGLANSRTSIFLHDYDRPMERECADFYFGTPSEVIGPKPLLATFSDFQ